MVVISYLYFVCFFFGGFVAKLHVAEWARKDLAITKPCMQQKVCSFSSPDTLCVVSARLSPLFGRRNCPGSEHLDH